MQNHEIRSRILSRNSAARTTRPSRDTVIKRNAELFRKTYSQEELQTLLDSFVSNPNNEGPFSRESINLALKLSSDQ